MTPAQVRLLKALIDADRQYHSKKLACIPTCNDERGIEVGPINGVALLTARSLVERDLAEMMDFGMGRTYIFLRKYIPYDEIRS